MIVKPAAIYPLPNPIACIPDIGGSATLECDQVARWIDGDEGAGEPGIVPSNSKFKMAAKTIARQNDLGVRLNESLTSDIVDHGFDIADHQSIELEITGALERKALPGRPPIIDGQHRQTLCQVGSRQDLGYRKVIGHRATMN